MVDSLLSDFSGDEKTPTWDMCELTKYILQQRKLSSISRQKQHCSNLKGNDSRYCRFFFFGFSFDSNIYVISELIFNSFYMNAKTNY